MNGVVDETFEKYIKKKGFSFFVCVCVCVTNPVFNKWAKARAEFRQRELTSWKEKENKNRKKKEAIK